MPGLVDSHVHMLDGGLLQLRCAVDEPKTPEILLAAIATCAAADPEAEWVLGSDLPLWLFDKRGPRKEQLDAVILDRPAVFYGEDGHSAWLNSDALGRVPRTVSGEYADCHGFRDSLGGAPMAWIAGTLALVLVASTATAQPYLVRDIDTGPAPDADSNPSEFTRVGDVVFFVARIGHRRQLWRTDGTQVGTVLVKDEVYPEQLTAAGDLLFFVGWEEETGSELWRSDGTEAGTFLARDIRPGPDPRQPLGVRKPMRLSAVDDVLYFAAADGVHGYELWRSDGTPHGTRMVADLLPGPAGSLEPYGPTFAGLDGVAYFPADSGGGDIEPWRSDGSPAGTHRLRDIRTGPAASQTSFTQFGVAAGHVWLGADDGEHGIELWRSDGTAAGTTMVKDIDPGPGSSNPSLPEFVGGALYFSADDGVHGRELWTTDGTADGTAMVADLEPGPLSSAPAHLVEAGGVLYLTIAPAPHFRPRRLWKLEDGSGIPLQTFGATRDVAPLPERLVFSGPLQDCPPPPFHCVLDSVLWTSRGTPESTAPLGLETPPFYPLFTSHAVLGGKVLFNADDRVRGYELWRTDGTAAGTVLVKDVHAVPGSSQPRWLTSFAGRVFFVAARPAGRRHLWASDGTSAGTVPLLVLDEPDSFSGPANLTASDALLFFTTASESERHLWRSAGLPETTFEVARFPEGGPWRITAAPGGISFVATTAETGSELWFSDGSVEGTRLVKDIRPGPSGSDIGSIVALGPMLFFMADDGAHGRQLWRSDGTGEGTQPVTRTPSTAGWSQARPIAAMEPLVFFVEPASVPPLTDLWRSDGSEPGTIRLLEEFHLGHGTAQAGGRLYFVASTPALGSEVWVTDGSREGTRLVVDLAPGPESSHPWALFPGFGGVFFQVSVGLGRNDLWHTDGTPAGTRLLREFRVVESVQQWVEVEGRPYFVTRTSDLFGTTEGYRLWRTDGTAEGTIPVAGLPLNVELDPYLATAGSRLFFPGTEERTGIELWALDLGEPTSCPADCDRSSVTTIADLRHAVGVALLEEARGSCPSADRDHDGRVTVDEIVGVVALRLAGECAG